MLVLFPSKNTKNSSVAMAMQQFFEFFRRKNYGALWNNLFNFFHLRSSAMRVKFSQTYKKNNFFIWGRLFSSSSLTLTSWQDILPSFCTLKLWKYQHLCEFQSPNWGQTLLIVIQESKFIYFAFLINFLSKYLYQTRDQYYNYPNDSRQDDTLNHFSRSTSFEVNAE